MIIDTTKIAIIILCYNKVLFDETVAYINELNVPIGYNIELVNVSNTDSITAGYNEGMRATDAKYKIYIRENCFLLNKNILNNVISIFEKDDKLGMLGLYGEDYIPYDGFIDYHNFQYGKRLNLENRQEVYSLFDTYSDEFVDSYNEVAFVSNEFIATSVDFEWDENESSNYYFEVYHSLRYIQEGYKVVVPCQNVPWILNDDSDNSYDYIVARRQFVSRYYHLLGKHISAINLIPSGYYEYEAAEQIEASGTRFQATKNALFHADRLLKRGCAYSIDSTSVYGDEIAEELLRNGYLNNKTTNLEQPKNAEMRVAIFVPTYNHPDNVCAVLEKSIDVYKNHNIDVYYIDSSDNETTKNVVNKFIDEGFDNLHYIYVETSKDGYGYEKMLWIYEQSLSDKKYDYIWPVKDRVFFSLKTIQCVRRMIKRSPDAILLGAGVKELADVKYVRYRDPAEFYRDWGWLSTSMDVMIYNAKTLLNGFSTDELKKYEWPVVIAWPQILTIYCRLDKIESPQIFVTTDKEIAPINLPNAGSGWTNRMLEVVVNWAKANLLLPARYGKYKEKVIRDFASLPWIMGKDETVYKIVQSESFNKALFDRIRPYWHLISSISESEIDGLLQQGEEML